MVSIVCCACVFASPTYLATPPRNHLCKEPKVRLTLYIILLMATLTRCCLSVIFLPPDSFVHDATFELHLSERLPVLSQILAFIGIDGRPLWEAGFLQGRFKMIDVALVGSHSLLGQNQSILVCYRMTLVAKVELFHLLIPSSVRCQTKVHNWDLN